MIDVTLKLSQSTLDLPDDDERVGTLESAIEELENAIEMYVKAEERRKEYVEARSRPRGVRSSRTIPRTRLRCLATTPARRSTAGPTTSTQSTRTPR